MYRSVSYLLADNWLICRLCVQCMISNSNVKLVPCDGVSARLKAEADNTYLELDYSQNITKTSSKKCLIDLKCNKKLIILPAFQLALLEISPVVLASVKRKSQITFFRHWSNNTWSHYIRNTIHSASNSKDRVVRTFSIGVFLGVDNFSPFSGLIAADTTGGLTSGTKIKKRFTNL